MVDWKKLQDLNLKEVSLKTQIEVRFLEALIKKDFLTLNRFNVYGFIKILSREYGFDFGDFIQEYEKYLGENNLGAQIKSRNSTVIHELDSYHPQKRFILLLVVSVIVFIGIIAFRVYYFDMFKSFFEDRENNMSTASVVNIVNEAQTNLKDLGSDVLIVGDGKNEDSSIQGGVNAGSFDGGFSNENNETSIEVNVSQNSASEEILPAQAGKSVARDTQTAGENSVSAGKQITFRADTKIWVGLIDLGTHRKTTSINEGDFNVSLDKDRLILTGAAALNVIDEEGKEEKFPAGASKRFLIKNGKIKSITPAEFIKLNKGREW